MCVLATSTVLHVVPLMLVALLKVLLPFPRVRRVCNPVLTGIAENWIAINTWLLDRYGGVHFDVAGMADLQVDGHYLVLANHQSWVDIVVLQKVFNRRIPLLRFFLKRQLIWVPLLGLAWWALDFPFMAATPAPRSPAIPSWDDATWRPRGGPARSSARCRWR